MLVPSLNVIMVAVDKDKNSVHAFRWITKNVDNAVIVAVHVKHKNIPHQGTNVFPPDEDDIARVFSHLRDLCDSNVIKMKEAVIDDSDVVKGILEYAQRNHIYNIVVGAPSSNKNTPARNWTLRVGNKKLVKGQDVATAVMKSAPDYSNVYVISKGKIVASRPATRPMGDMETEMKRLKFKLKQTMDMYSSACKEAVTAQNQVKEINKWKLEYGARVVEEAKLSTEAALEVAEKEKVKAKAAMEAAEEAMKMAEMEAQRRLHVEMKARKEEEQTNEALSDLVNRDMRCRRYNIHEIEEATQKFSISLKVGEGGYGPVFRGQLDHTPVAIKILDPEASHGKRQFQQEVEILCSIRHPNLVLLLGACPEYGCIVYEFLENGCLEDRLLRKHNSPPIPWWKRFEISAEIATALLFLHQTKPDPIVHRDLKPANILLDKNYVSKISDVGLARLVPSSVADSVTQCHLTAAAGTLCYIDPEYQQTGKLTTKSDTYSLGILLLQIVTAKPAMGLLHHVKRAIDDGTFSNMLDPSVTDWPLEETLSFVKLALSCAELSKKDRPDLATIVVPELCRLRDFGYSYENNCHSFCHLSLPLNPTRSLHGKTLST
ncbi:hypothetical protein RJT34_11474 [Clitoria ternatea]|uniref:RING-type E3 ubiquitin transferase n=1 Tax=Clitoria ternatea TaxID=43366 RepID=A0AAN9JLZ7_CLITE